MACTEDEKLATVAAISGSNGIASAGGISHGRIGVIEDIVGLIFR
jgi:hypothetical protein